MVVIAFISGYLSFQDYLSSYPFLYKISHKNRKGNWHALPTVIEIFFMKYKLSIIAKVILHLFTFVNKTSDQALENK